MVDQEMLEAIGKMMDEKLRPIADRLDKLEESNAEVRSGVKFTYVICCFGLSILRRDFRDTAESPAAVCL